MPEYRFTTTIDGQVDEADETLSYATEKAATDAAQESLVDMARDRLPNGKHVEFSTSVTDDRGEEIYRAKMSVNARTKDDIAADELEADNALEELRRVLDPTHCPL